MSRLQKAFFWEKPSAFARGSLLCRACRRNSAGTADCPCLVLTQGSASCCDPAGILKVIISIQKQHCVTLYHCPPSKTTQRWLWLSLGGPGKVKSAVYFSIFSNKLCTKRIEDRLQAEGEHTTWHDFIVT